MEELMVLRNQAMQSGNNANFSWSSSLNMANFWSTTPPLHGVPQMEKEIMGCYSYNHQEQSQCLSSSTCINNMEMAQNLDTQEWEIPQAPLLHNVLSPYGMDTSTMDMLVIQQQMQSNAEISTRLENVTHMEQCGELLESLVHRREMSPTVVTEHKEGEHGKPKNMVLCSSVGSSSEHDEHFSVSHATSDPSPSPSPITKNPNSKDSHAIQKPKTPIHSNKPLCNITTVSKPLIASKPNGKKRKVNSSSCKKPSTESQCLVFGHEESLSIEPDTEAIATMREMIYRAAVFRPVSLGSEDEFKEKPKRKNVKISSDPQTVAARQRRERISDRIRILQKLVPGGTKMDTASMLDEAVNYLKYLKSQVRVLQSLNTNSKGHVQAQHSNVACSSDAVLHQGGSAAWAASSSCSLPLNPNQLDHVLAPYSPLNDRYV